MLEVFDCEQGSPEWFECRMGIPTASMFSTVMASGRGGAPSKTRRTYMLQLIGERITGEPKINYSNQHMERGQLMEAEARDSYAFITGNTPELVGFMRNGRQGASPDSLIDSDGLLEIKTKLPHLQLEVLLADTIPAEHIKQIQGQLWISEREWCDFVSYWPGLPVFIKRANRDERLIGEIQREVGRFNDEMCEIEEKIRSMAC